MPDPLLSHIRSQLFSCTRKTTSTTSNEDSSATEYAVTPIDNCTTDSAMFATQTAGTSIHITASISDVLTASKTTLTTSTILPPSSPGTPLQASTSALPVTHTSHSPSMPIALGVICGIIPIAVLLFMGCWRWRKPESFQKRRDQVAGWYNSVRQRCYVHNFGWGIGATLTRMKETRERNKDYRTRRNASTPTSTIHLTGDGMETEKDNMMQRWRKRREREVEERRERREAMEQSSEEKDKVQEERDRHWRERSQDPRVAEAEAEWEKIKRQNKEQYMALDERDDRDVWWRDDIRGAGSEADTTLAGSRMRRSDCSQESWVEKWRRMGEKLPPNPHESQGSGVGDQIHPAMRQR